MNKTLDAVSSAMLSRIPSEKDGPKAWVAWNNIVISLCAKLSGAESDFPYDDFIRACNGTQSVKSNASCSAWKHALASKKKIS
jgi:hypothetical protein